MRFLTIFVILTALCLGANAADLYQVKVTNPDDAASLRAAGVVPIARVNDEFIMLMEPGTLLPTLESELPRTLLANDIALDQLAWDGTLDESLEDKYRLLFAQNRLRLYQVDWNDPGIQAQEGSLIRVREVSLTIEAVSPAVAPLRGDSRALGDLDSLINLVQHDTLFEYVSTLQAFPGRVEGSSGNYQARDWIVSKFEEFGYDSVYLDPFDGVNYNVVATKIGTRFPNHQVVVGGHFDAVPGSPGADDNGSGTTGTLELARILADIETDMTFVFVTFDAEETGLNGSYHYADVAEANGDDIVYMFNMDMIGSVNNDTEVTVYHGTETDYSNTYLWLADSLLGVTGYLSGNIAASDHYPFTQKGWTVTFIIEYNFSPVYHTYQDSTTWMDFTYMTKLVKSALATTYYISQTEGPLPSLAFSYPGGLPEVLAPGEEMTFDVQIDEVFAGDLVPGTAKCHYNTDHHGWNNSDMTDLGGGLFEATIPGADCDSRVEFYVSAEEASSGVIEDPGSASPRVAIVATEVTTVFADDFETSTGWTVSGSVTDGPWTRGVPVGGGERGDPPTDFDGSGACYLTDNVAGNSDVDGGTTILTSPTIDLSGVDDAQIHYARWYHNSFGGAPFTDSMLIWISNNNGSNWTLVEVVGPTEQASGGWYENTFWISGYVAPTDQVRMRFDAADLGEGSVVEAGVDDFSVKTYFCEDPFVCGDADGNGIAADIADLVYLVTYMFQEGPPPPVMEAVDVNNDGEPADIADLVYIVEYMFGEGPDLNCP